MGRTLKKYNNEEIVRGLIKQDDRVIDHVYRTAYPRVRKLVLFNHGNESDARDVFQESLLCIYKKIREGSFRINCRFITYLYSISRLLWLKELERKNRMDMEYEDTDELEGKLVLKGKTELSKAKMFEKHFRQLGKECQKVLYLYLDNASMKEICRIMGYKNVETARAKKYRCKETLISKIYRNPEYNILENEIQLVG